MSVHPAASGGLFKKIFGGLANIIPYALKKTGLPEDVAEAMGAKGNFWAGVTLGAGAALMGGGMLLGALSGGALLAPGLLGSVLLNGAVATASVAVGGFLLRETAKELGGGLLRKIGGAIFGKIFGRGNDANNDAGKDRYAEHRITPHMLRAVPAGAGFGMRPLKQRFAHAHAQTPRRDRKAEPRPTGPRFAYDAPRI